MLKFFAAIALAASCMQSAHGQEPGSSYLILHLADGTTADYHLAYCPVLTFEDALLKITSQTAAITYERSQVTHFDFSDTPTGIAQATGAASFRFFYTDNATVNVEGVIQTLRLYSADGRCLRVVAPNNGRAVVSVAGLAPGTYLLDAGNKQTIKIYKK